ncbi:MAG TPA: RNA 2',3'-cyclic phosphodiesterase [Anaerolineales bacterium]|nr:RNA 2',3'-cyclic phosphodiesterase [Anaerolineales bacterium]
MIRSFIAIDLEPAARARLDEVQERFRSEWGRESIRWVRPDAIHLTLKFLGSRTADDLDKISALLETLAVRATVYHLTITGVGCFPDARNPRVVWAGVEEKSGRLVEWARMLDESLEKLGIEPERRAFRPHLTLGRFKNRLSSEGQPRWEARMAALKSEVIAESRATTVDLIRSDLRPEGPVYTVLKQARLGGGVEP